MCINTHPVQQTKHKTQHRIHMYLIHSMNIAHSFYNDHNNAQHFYWYTKQSHLMRTYKTYQYQYQPEQAEIKLCNICRFINIDIPYCNISL